MDRKNTAEGTDGEEGSEPRPRRDGSPAMSVASAVLEWDPSADVGAMGSASSDGKTQNIRNQLSQRHVVEGFSQCDIVYGPTVYDLEGGKSPSRSRPGSGRSRRGQHQNVRGCTYSTPSSSPVPLVDLQYSPVVQQSSYSHEQSSNNVQMGAGPSQNIGIDSVSKGKFATTTSDEDNNDDLTEGRRTPGRAVSESSTDWEYDQEKNVPTTASLSQWQTSGLTKSEIEYQTRKKNGSSTSIASSVLMLKVETKLGSPDRGSPEHKKKSRKQPVHSSSQEKSEESELNRKIHKILKEHQAKRKNPAHDTGTTSVSDPSTMCGLVKDYVELLEGDSSKENIQYDVLKKHRDYHLMKVWKQISTLEKLNMQLLRLESARARQSKQSGTRYVNRRGEGDADYRSNHGRGAGGGSAAHGQNILRMRNDLAQELAAFFRNSEGVKRDNSAFKSSRKEYSSDPTMASLNARMQANIPTNFHVTSRGTSMPYLVPRNSRESQEMDYRKGTSNRNREDMSRRKKSSRSRPQEYLSDPDVVTLESEIEENDHAYHHEKATGAVAISYPVLKELISKIVVPEEMLKQKKKYDDRKKLPSARNYSTSLSVKASSTENYSDEDLSERIPVQRPKTRRKVESSSSSGQSRKESLHEERRSTPEIPKPKKPPVGFFVPLFFDDYGTSIASSGTSKRQHKWFGNEKGENGLYDVRGPMKIQDCLKENYPDCYQSIKDRDEFIIHRKIDRQIREESLLREILASDIPYEDVEEYMSTYLKHCNPEQKRRALDYLETYEKTKASGGDRRIISSKEMRERTARFLQYDFIEKQKREALERKKQAIRHSQRNFSKNLRKYQQLGKVNVPDQLKLGRIK